MMFACVILIAFSASFGSDEEKITKTEDQISSEKQYLILAIVMAFMVAFVDPIYTVGIQYIYQTGFDLEQANYDGNAMLSLILLPFFVAFYDQYTLIDIFIGTFIVLGWTIGGVLYSKALVCGHAGPVNAISAMKIIQIILTTIVDGQIPNLM